MEKYRNYVDEPIGIVYSVIYWPISDLKKKLINFFLLDIYILNE